MNKLSIWEACQAEGSYPDRFFQNTERTSSMESVSGKLTEQHEGVQRTNLLSTCSVETCLMKQPWELDPWRAKYVLLSHLRIAEFKLLLQFWEKKDKWSMTSPSSNHILKLYRLSINTYSSINFFNLFGKFLGKIGKIMNSSIWK